jgi:rubrerythrin
MPSTVENLKVAFAGESQANRKYLAFAKKAEKEGYGQIAKLFRAAAEAETIHALAHLQNMGGVGSTLENLREAIGGETYEFTEMYPPMVAQAVAEQHKAKAMLEWANGVERVHASLFQQALAALESGQDLSRMDVYLCPVCGDVEFGVPPEKCLCAARRARGTRRSRSAGSSAAVTTKAPAPRGARGISSSRRGRLLVSPRGPRRSTTPPLSVRSRHAWSLWRRSRGIACAHGSGSEGCSRSSGSSSSRRSPVPYGRNRASRSQRTRRPGASSPTRRG